MQSAHTVSQRIGWQTRHNNNNDKNNSARYSNNAKNKKKGSNNNNNIIVGCKLNTWWVTRRQTWHNKNNNNNTRNSNYTKIIWRAVTITCKKTLDESEEDKLGTACTKAVQMYLVLELLILLKCLFKSRRGSLELTWILCPRKLTLQQVADKPEKRPSDTISYSVESQA